MSNPRYKELLSELVALSLKENAPEPTEKSVPFSTYRSAIIALRRCHAILEDLLPHIPEYKQSDTRVYLKILGDMQSDVSVYAKIGFLEEFVAPVSDPYPNRYPMMDAKKKKVKRKSR